MGKKTPREKSVGKGSDEGDEDFRKKGGEGMRFHRRGEKLTRTEKKTEKRKREREEQGEQWNRKENRGARKVSGPASWAEPLKSFYSL